MKTVVDVPEGLYPMRVVTRMTGLSADTVRAWERRYGAVRPDRSHGNARRYSADQVRRLLLLREAIGRGHAIGDLAVLAEEDLRGLIGGEPVPIDAIEQRFERLREHYLAAIRELDTGRAFDILSRAAGLMPPRDTIFRLVVPLLHRVGEQWSAGQLLVTHEHVVSHHLRTVLDSMLRTASLPRGARRMVIGTPQGHRHEFGALVGAFIAAGRGVEPLVVGCDIPHGELRPLMERSRADMLVLSVVRDLEPGEGSELEGALRPLAMDYTLWVGLPEGHELTDRGIRARWFHRFADFEAAVTHRAS